MTRRPDPQRVRAQIYRHPRGGHCQSCEPHTPYGPLCYPDSHHGWAVLMTEVAAAFAPPGGRRHATADGHVPLRWRLLVHYRDQGDLWSDVGRMFGMSAQGAAQAYAAWKPKMCCPDTDSKAA